jgi:cytochrome P450
MRITSPAEGARTSIDSINLADNDLYTHGDAHLAWKTLRAECPVYWQARRNGEGFWAVTRRADVCRVLGEHETFTSEGGTAISMLDAPDPAAGIMMQASDPPRHQQFREQLGRPFSPRAVRAYADRIRAFVQDAIEPARDGEVWDAAASFSRLPMTVGAMLMGLPDADVDPLVGLAYASLAPGDPHYRIAGSAGSIAVSAHFKIIDYFTRCIEDRKRNLAEDLISYLITAEIGGRRMTDEELMSNCLSVLLGAVVTTSHAISATLVALTEQYGGEGRWPDDMPIEAAVEEALRWSSPVNHFMRRARHDTEISGQKIAAGEPVAAWIASANRDERAFERPYELDFGRTPNRHVSFGSGPHLCLGSHLARLMLRNSFDELVTSIGSFELADPPVHLVSTEIAGVVSLPLRIRLRERLAPQDGGIAAR